MFIFATENQIQMRKLFTFIVCILSASLFVACDNKPHHTLYAIQVESIVSCTYDRQTIEIGYQLMGEEAPITVTTSAEWILNIDAETEGKIKLDIAANDGGERVARLVIKATGHQTTEVQISQISAPKGASHTLMFYFFGTSLERYFRTNIEDAMTAIKEGALGDNNRVIFLLQYGTSSAYISEICYDRTSGKCMERKIENIKINSSHITTEEIGQNIAKMAEYAPADRYGIVFAGHGQGWIPREVLNGSGGISSLSVSYDVWQPAMGAEVTRAFGETNVQVNPSELAEGIEKSNVELDYILFDACFMANIEAVYDLRNAANYIIASPCEIMGKGFPYHRTLPYLFAANGASSDLKGAAESYYRFYRDEYSSSSRCGSVAVFDCAEVDALAETTKRVVSTAREEYDTSKLQTYEGQSKHQFYDFGEWANVVATDEAALAAFNSQLENTIIAKYSLPSFYSAYGSYGTYPIDLDVYSGVTTSAPSVAHPAAWRETNWYKNVWQE